MRPGMLVQIRAGTKQDDPALGADQMELARMSGEQAQLIRLSQSNDRRIWVAVLFNGEKIRVDERLLVPLEGEAVSSYHAVMGPSSDTELVADELMSCLVAEGYAIMRVFMSPKEAVEITRAVELLEVDGAFQRLPQEFEKGFLGIDKGAKVSNVDMDAPDTPEYVKKSPLKTVDDCFAVLLHVLGKRSMHNLGYLLEERTDLLLRMPLDGFDTARYPPVKIDDGDAEDHMHLMSRKRLAVLHFVGPSTGILALTPKMVNGAEVRLLVEPSTVVLIATDRYEYSFTAEPEALMVQTLFLTTPPGYELDEVVGNLQMLFQGTTKPPPFGDQVSVEALSCRYGSRSESRGDFWRAVGKGGTDGIQEVPMTRWDLTQYLDLEGSTGKHYTRHGCFGVEGTAYFDNKFFDIQPKEVTSMDPIQRQVLEVSYMSLLEAGFEKKTLQRESKNIGHFVGVDKDDWMCMGALGLLDVRCHAITTSPVMPPHACSSASNSITANRFSYLLNLRGASMSIDTACSSSLVCTHVAKLNLRLRDYDPMVAAIVNGINLLLYPGPFVNCCAAQMLSHQGRCFTFDTSADGYTRGELCGSGCFKCKPYDDASLACLAGSHVNQDGRSATLTAPSGPAQERLLRAVLWECQLKGSEVDCTECHGTGTALGDSIEVGSVRRVMNGRVSPVVATSNKSVIGHGEGGAGFAGFLKCCVQVGHCEAAANLHLRDTNPHMDFEGYPCYLLTESVVMKELSAYSGVSSFGFGGTNGHAEAWGRLILNSRSAAAQDPRVALDKRLAVAPPADITMTGDDVRHWRTDGLDPYADTSMKFKVRFESTGAIKWEPAEEQALGPGTMFFIQGTFNSWQLGELRRDTVINGLWTFELVVGSSGEEQFQIVADGDISMVYHPPCARCTRKAALVVGPEPAEKEVAWLIQGSPGDMFKVEFFLQGNKRTMLWFRFQL